MKTTGEGKFGLIVVWPDHVEEKYLFKTKVIRDRWKASFEAREDILSVEVIDS